MGILYSFNFLLYIALLGPARAQFNDPALQQLQDRITSSLAKQKTGSLYMFTDKSIYVPNESVWLSAYQFLDGQQASYPDTIEHTLYVMLTDRYTQQVILSRRYKMQNNISSGVFSLPDSIPDGNYSLVAYTDNYLLGKTNSLFSKSFFVRSYRESPFRVASFDTDTQNAEDSLRLKYLVYGPDGLTPGLNVSYKIYAGSDLEDQGRTISNNMGEVHITVPVKKEYNAQNCDILMSVSNKANTKTVDFPIPRLFTEQGKQRMLHAALNKEQDEIQVELSELNTNLTYYLLFYNETGILYSATVSPNKTDELLNFPTDSFPKGHLHIAFFDANHTKLSERSLLLTPNHIGFTITADSSQYDTRSLVKLKIKCVGPDGKPIQGLISLSCVPTMRLTSNEKEIKEYFYPEVNQTIPPSIIPKGKDTVEGWVTLLNKKLQKPVVIVVQGLAMHVMPTDWMGHFLIQTKMMEDYAGQKVTVSVADRSVTGYSLKIHEPDRDLNTYLATNYKPINDYTLNLPIKDIFTEQEKKSMRGLLKTAVVLAPSKTMEGRPIIPYVDTACNAFVCSCDHWRCSGCPPTLKPTKGKYYFDLRNNTIVLYEGCYGEVLDPFVKNIEPVSLPAVFQQFLPAATLTPYLYSTLYWDPFIRLNEKGEASVQFYTNDLEGNFSVVAQGISVAGPLETKLAIHVK